MEMKIIHINSTTPPQSSTKSTCTRDPTVSRRSGSGKRRTRRRVMSVFCIGLAAACVLIACLLGSSLPPEQSAPRNISNPCKEPPTRAPVQPSAQPSAQQQSAPPYTPEEVRIVAQTVFGESSVCSRAEQRLVAWCICNRVDTGFWGDTITDVVTPTQFNGYDPECDVPEEYLDIAREVLEEWASGQPADVCPPYADSSDYLYFYGDGYHNWFRKDW